ncbi:MAG: hypothetical protein H6965_16720 [Chromatiaceae bacterium]|nr:hypothetical protein [Chromatiaceae bacterium]
MAGKFVLFFMDEFISLAVEKLGFPEVSARKVTAELLRLILDHVETEEAEELLQTFPEIAELVEGMQRSWFSKVIDKLRRIFGLVPDLQQLMLCIDRGEESLRPFLQLFVDYLKAHAGNNLVPRILSQYQQLDESLG